MGEGPYGPRRTPLWLVMAVMVLLALLAVYAIR